MDDQVTHEKGVGGENGGEGGAGKVSEPVLEEIAGQVEPVEDDQQDHQRRHARQNHQTEFPEERFAGAAAAVDPDFGEQVPQPLRLLFELVFGLDVRVDVRLQFLKGHLLHVSRRSRVFGVGVSADGEGETGYQLVELFFAVGVPQTEQLFAHHLHLELNQDLEVGQEGFFASDFCVEVACLASRAETQQSFFQDVGQAETEGGDQENHPPNVRQCFE